jgi:hypothetical protein
MRKTMIGILLGLALFGTGAWTAASAGSAPADRHFELRIYTAAEGKMEALHARFRSHTNKLFVKHGMELVGYWVVNSGPNAGKDLAYVLAYPSKEARAASWKAFVNDPEWKAAKAASEVDGTLVAKVDSRFMDPTDYSPIK